MKKLFLALFFCTLMLCGCSTKVGNEISETDVPETSSVTVTTEISAAVAEEETTAMITTTIAKRETTVIKPAEEEIILTPIPSKEPFEIMSCKIIEDIAVDNEEDFYDKAVLKRAKEICFEDEEIHKIIVEANNGYTEEEYGENAAERKIETAEDISFICGLRYDFDGDSEYEYVLSLQYFSTPVGMGGAFVIYMDDDKYKILETGGNPVAPKQIKIITSGSYDFLMLFTSAGFLWYSEDIYGFESGMPEKATDFDDEESKSVYCENGIFYLQYKGSYTSKPFVLCGDGVFRQLGREKITRDDFEAHVRNGGAYLDSLAENGDEITEIYTYGYFNYELCGEDFYYNVYSSLYGDAKGTFQTRRRDRLPEEEVRFTDEVVYGDLWAVQPIHRSQNYDIGGGYVCFTTGEAENKVLNVAKDNVITDSIKTGIFDPDWQIKFYDMDVPPCFALKTSSWDIEYRTYFVIDGKITEMNWTLDGEKLDKIDYTMLQCRGENNGEFVSYSIPVWEDDRFTKRHFTFAEDDYTNIVGYSEDIEDKITKEYSENLHGYVRHTLQLLDSGANARTAYETLSKFVNFWSAVYSDRNFSVMDDNKLWGRLEKEGFRTREELLDTLSEFCTSAAADEAYSMLIESKYSDFYEIDGRFYLYDGSPSTYLPYYFIESAEEKDGVITARFFAYYSGQDIPYVICPPLYAEFVFEDGVWKISSLPKER